MTLPRLWLFLAVALPALVALLVPLPAVDLAYQVRVGEQILRTGAIPAADTFTFTIAGAPWTDQQWLAQVLMALGYRAGGWEMLAVMRAVLVSATGGLLVVAGLARGASARTSSVLSLLAFMLAAPALALRPQLFAIVVFACLLVLVAARDRHPRLYLAAPVLVAVWANLHGSFVLAPVLLGYAWLDDVARGRPAGRSFAVLAAGSAATLLNPFGPAVWAYAAGIGANPVIAGRVTEWQRTSPFTITGLLFYASGAAVAAVAWFRRRCLAWPDVVWLLATFALGAWAVRGVAWWPAAALPVVATVWAGPVLPIEGNARGAATARRPRQSPLNLVVAGLLIVLLLVALPWLRPVDPLTGRTGLLTYAPSGLAAALRPITPPGTRVFTPQVWASWFEWAVPDARYLVDARFELFPADAWADLDTITSGGADAAAVLDRLEVRVIVLPAGWVSPGAGWNVVYADADGAILSRNGS